MSKNFALINQKCADEPLEYSKKVNVLVKQINEYEVTLNSIIANVEILKEANRKLQVRCVQKPTYVYYNIGIHIYLVPLQLYIYFIFKTTIVLLLIHVQHVLFFNNLANFK